MGYARRIFRSTHQMTGHAGGLKGVQHTAEIARTVINHAKFHVFYSIPLVEGSVPAARGSIAAACRNAWAMPLKTDSAMWWPSLP